MYVICFFFLTIYIFLHVIYFRPSPLTSPQRAQQASHQAEHNQCTIGSSPSRCRRHPHPPVFSSTAGPSNAAAGPSNAAADPFNAAADPSNATAGLSNATAGPSNAAAGPSNAALMVCINFITESYFYLIFLYTF